MKHPEIMRIVKYIKLSADSIFSKNIRIRMCPGEIFYSGHSFI